jgi:hypothetical protein
VKDELLSNAEHDRSLNNQIKLYENSFKQLLAELNELTDKFSKLFHSSSESIIGKEKWTYETLPEKDLIQEKLKDILYGSKDFSRIGFAYHFHDYKFTNKPFSLEVKIFFSFIEPKYYINYSVAECFELNNCQPGKFNKKPDSLVANYYSQNISQQEKDYCFNDIEEDISWCLKREFYKRF